MVRPSRFQLRSNSLQLSTVAGQTLFPLITDALLDMANTSIVKIAHFQTAYKPFLSLMNMTDVGRGALLYPEGIVDYASVATFELRENMAGTGHDGAFVLASLPRFDRQLTLARSSVWLPERDNRR